MEIKKEELESPKKSINRSDIVAATQYEGIKKAIAYVEEIFHIGIQPADDDFLDDVSSEMEELMDSYLSNIVYEFRYLLMYFYYMYTSNRHPDIVAQINHLVAVLTRAEKYLKSRIDGMEPDPASLIEDYLGYMWRTGDLVKYKMYKEDAEIIQLSFDRFDDQIKPVPVEKGYWFDLKTHEIHYTCRIRPRRGTQHVKSDDTEFDVLLPEMLFIYQGKVNRRIRWMKAQRRAITPKDLAVLLESAEPDYADAVSRIKETFRDPLIDHAPVLLIKLHKAFVQGDHLVLEDERGGLLTVMDNPVEDDNPTLELLRSILPAQSTGCALLVKVNNNIHLKLFSVKPLSIITPDKIIRLLF
jgi:hypothetical protein